jgi:hypothetical protein
LQHVLCADELEKEPEPMALVKPATPSKKAARASTKAITTKRKVLLKVGGAHYYNNNYCCCCILDQGYQSHCRVFH